MARIPVEESPGIYRCPVSGSPCWSCHCIRELRRRYRPLRGRLRYTDVEDCRFLWHFCRKLISKLKERDMTLMIITVYQLDYMTPASCFLSEVSNCTVHFTTNALFNWSIVSWHRDFDVRHPLCHRQDAWTHTPRFGSYGHICGSTGPRSLSRHGDQ